MKHRLFFAIMIQGRVRTEIASRFEPFQACYEFQSTPIPSERLHLSLYALFAGDCIPEPVAKLAERAGGATRCEKFEITLTRALSFRNTRGKKPFVFGAPSEAGSVNQLSRRIAGALNALSGSKVHKAQVNTPHVTLIWDPVIISEQRISPIIMPVREFALVHSYVGQSRYDILGRWPLV